MTINKGYYPNQHLQCKPVRRTFGMLGSKLGIAQRLNYFIGIRKIKVVLGKKVNRLRGCKNNPNK